MHICRDINFNNKALSNIGSVALPSGLSSQFLKGDGSTDTNTFLTSSSTDITN